jgi:hypothetical protein
MGSNDQRGGSDRARQVGGRSGLRSGHGSGRGRDGRGRGRGRSNERKTYANIVAISDPHRNLISDEWERLGSMRSYVLQLRDAWRSLWPRTRRPELPREQCESINQQCICS